MTVYAADALPDNGWAEYRKITTTRMVPAAGPCTVQTQEGSYDLPDGWEGFIAVDNQGYPYPISAATHAETYERVS